MRKSVLTFILFIMPIIAFSQKVIRHPDLENCPPDVKNSFRAETKKIIPSYTLLTKAKEGEDEVLMMKNKDSDSFHELVILELGENAHLTKLEGIFDISGLSALKEYNE